jgi:hypothetical protein
MRALISEPGFTFLLLLEDNQPLATYEYRSTLPPRLGACEDVRRELPMSLRLPRPQTHTGVLRVHF